MWGKIICFVVGMATGALAASYISGYNAGVDYKDIRRREQPEATTAPNVEASAVDDIASGASGDASKTEETSGLVLTGNTA